jgi:photosystem II stability/assembly factor-like uncharacterized protein
MTPPWNLVDVNRQIDDLSVVSDKDIWLIGGNRGERRAYGHSTDGSVTFSWKTLPAKDLTAIHFMDAKTGWIGTIDGEVLTTANGGDSWSSVGFIYKSPVKIDRLYFVSTLIGFASTQVGTMQTQDGGKSWSSVSESRFFGGVIGLARIAAINNSQPPEADTYSAMTAAISRSERREAYFSIKQVFPITSSRWIAVAEPGALLETNDSGQTWENRSPKESGSSTNARYGLVGDLRLQHLQLIASLKDGNGNTRTRFYQSKDAGQSWSTSLPQPFETVNVGFLTSPTTGWAVADRRLYRFGFGIALRLN